jgi:hypothetical protein
MGRLSHDGRWLVPGMESGSEGGVERKSEREGPALRASVKVVCGRRGETVARQRTVVAATPAFAAVLVRRFEGVWTSRRHWLRRRIVPGGEAMLLEMLLGSDQ